MVAAKTSLRLPDFIIAGAPRCATTWLAEMLNRHPYISMAVPLKPEPKFFLVDDLFARGIEYYSQTWFEGLPANHLVGEKSTNYLESSEAAQRIFEHLPCVRLIFILRNPVDRAYSNYLWSAKNGLENESFPRALELEEKRNLILPDNFKYSRPFSYFSRGLYAQMLNPYFILFPRKSILILRYEDLLDDSEKFVDAVFDFLGVHPSPQHTGTLGIVNSARSALSVSIPRIRQNNSHADMYLRMRNLSSSSAMNSGHKLCNMARPTSLPRHGV